VSRKVIPVAEADRNPQLDRSSFHDGWTEAFESLGTYINSRTD
jgi:hypothetical protein